MAISSAQVSVGETPTALNAVNETDWIRVWVQVPSGGVEVFLGGNGVTAATGYSLGVGTREEILVPPRQVLNAVTEAGASTVHVLRSS